MAYSYTMSTGLHRYHLKKNFIERREGENAEFHAYPSQEQFQYFEEDNSVHVQEMTLQSSEPIVSLRSDELKVPLQSNEPVVSLRSDELETPLQSNELVVSLRSNEVEVPLHSNVPVVSLRSDELETPLQSNEPLVTLESGKLEVPLQFNVPVVSLRSDELEVPLQSNELVVSLRSNELEVPLQSNMPVVSLRSDELEVPLRSDVGIDSQNSHKLSKTVQPVHCKTPTGQIDNRTSNVVSIQESLNNSCDVGQFIQCRHNADTRHRQGNTFRKKLKRIHPQRVYINAEVKRRLKSKVSTQDHSDVETATRMTIIPEADDTEATGGIPHLGIFDEPVYQSPIKPGTNVSLKQFLAHRPHQEK